MRNSKLPRLAIMLAAVFSATACGTSEPVRYYGLVPVESASHYTTPATMTLSVGPVRMAEYLNRPQIVTRGAGVDMNFGEYDRWTEPLANSFQRILADNLAVLLDSNRVLEFPTTPALDGGYQVPIQVTRLDADTAGEAVLEVQWLVRSSGDAHVVPARRSRYTTRVEDPADYGSVVEALSRVVALFAREIAATVAELP